MYKENCTNQHTRNKKKLSNKSTDSDTVAAESTSNEEEVEIVESNSVERVIAPGQSTSAFQNFVPTTKLKGMEDWVEEDDQFQYIEPSYDFVATKKTDSLFDYPPLLKAFVFPRGDVTRFPPPKRSSLGTSSQLTH